MRFFMSVAHFVCEDGALVRVESLGEGLREAYVFFTELVGVDDGFVGCVEGSELLLRFGREGEEEVGYDEGLDKYVSSE